MKKYLAKQIIKILLKNGWREIRIRGSHHMLEKDGIRNLVVISTSKKIIPIGTLKNIEKQSGLKFK